MVSPPINFLLPPLSNFCPFTIRPFLEQSVMNTSYDSDRLSPSVFTHVNFACSAETNYIYNRKKKKNSERASEREYIYITNVGTQIDQKHGPTKEGRKKKKKVEI